MIVRERLNDGLSVLTVGSGPPLVSIPGLGEGVDLSVRAPLPDMLSARALARTTGRTVHTIARPLDPTPGMTISNLASAYAVAIEERFGCAVDIFGTSAGGVTGLQLALDSPATVRRLVVACAASRVGAAGRAGLSESIRHDGRRFRAAWTGSGLIGHGPARTAALAMMVVMGSRPRAAGERAMVEGGQSWDITNELGRIKAPTLIVGGTRDALFPAELIETTARGIPDAQLVLLHGRGHMTTLLDKRATEAVRKFLAMPST